MTTSTEPPATETHARLPGFFLVGHSKSGTTALYEMLKRHPQLFLPDFKEPSYFATDLRPRTRRRVPEPETLEDYLRLFDSAAPDQLTGDASSLYLYSREAASAIARAAPDARIVAILREPASFLYSLHLQLLQNRLEDERDLARAIALEPERRAGRHIPAGCYRPQALLYSERVRYVEQLRRYREAFAPEQMLVLIYDDFRDDNAATVRTVLRFLGVDEDVELPAVEANPSVAVRSPRLDALRHRLSGGANAPAGVRGPASSPALRARRVVGGWGRRFLYREPPPPDEQVMLELRRRFAPEVAALGEYLHRDLITLWGYDALE
ncbi:MAG TPA: sulfotransferase [Solirubrobacteraceae bacterium]|nr:sulfotransferase [Solirubrobacteraceae bacterium]